MIPREKWAPQVEMDVAVVPMRMTLLVKCLRCDRETEMKQGSSPYKIGLWARHHECVPVSEEAML